MERASNETDFTFEMTESLDNLSPNSIATMMAYTSTLEPQSTHATQNLMRHCTLTAKIPSKTPEQLNKLSSLFLSLSVAPSKLLI